MRAVGKLLARADVVAAGNKGKQQIGEVIERVCEEENINSHELRMGSRRRRISQVRAQIVHQLVENFGIPLAEVARQAGNSPRPPDCSKYPELNSYVF